MGEGDEQCTVCFHVDDLMITCKNEATVDMVIEKLREEFKTITVHDGPVFSYLGMTFDFAQDGKVKITMEKYIEDVIDPFKLTLRNRKINVQIFCKDSTKRSG